MAECDWAVAGEAGDILTAPGIVLATFPSGAFRGTAISAKMTWS